MPEMNTTVHHEEMVTIDKREVSGFTWRQLAWAIGAVVMVEFSILGVYFGIKSSIDSMAMGNVLRDQKINALETWKEHVDNELRNLDKRQSNTEFQLSDTYSERLQKKYDETH